MINVKKGPAMSLKQADVRGTSVTGVTAGMVCYLGTDGAIHIGGTPSGSTGIMGFAINNSTDGDAVESNKIALYTLDGISIIETDQITGALTNYPVGAPVYAASTGLITSSNTNQGGVIGWVEGQRSLQASPGQLLGSQSYPSLTENLNGTPTTLTYNYKGQTNVTVVSIKLASANPVATGSI
jgi:hypothetical protein